MKPGTAKQVKKKNKRKIKKGQTRNWLDLPRDVMLHIFLKLGVIDLLFNAQSVCSTWRKLAREPQLFRHIDFSNPWKHFDECNFTPLTNMAIEAIDRSCGQLVDFSIMYFGTDDVLQHIISEDVLIESLEKFPLLDEFELCLCSFSVEVIKVAGRSCPQLKSFRLNQKAVVYPPSEVMEEFNEEAFAIAANMPQLRRLHLFGNTMNDDGLRAILEKCPHLEYLDLRQCFHININEDFRKKFEGIKEIRLPNDSTDGYEFESSVHYMGSYDDDDDYTSEYNDYIYGMSDLELSDYDDFVFFDDYDGNEADL
ncbi:hypothetical protein ACHQM5_010548 [Ranunculus cassubicifolius]